VASLREIVAPAHTVLLTMECQRGVIGDLSSFPLLREAAASEGVLTNGARLCAHARDAGVRVIHCTVERRRDLAGTVVNNRMLAASMKATGNGNGLWTGSAGAEVVHEFLPDDRDLVSSRLHGLTPFTGTGLDQLIRNLGATTVVAIGVSLNIGILGLALSASDLGYQVVIPTDAVTGVPVEFGRQILEGTLRFIATLTTTAEVCTAWPAAF
jgi:nicotinamidase-related amidase